MSKKHTRFRVTVDLESPVPLTREEMVGQFNGALGTSKYISWWGHGTLEPDEGAAPKPNTSIFGSQPKALA